MTNLHKNTFMPINLFSETCVPENRTLKIKKRGENNHLLTMKRLFTIIFLSILFLCSTAQAAEVVLSWQQPDHPDLDGYNIYYGLEDSNFKSTPKTTINYASQTQCTITELEPGQFYVFSATSLDTRGNESDYSDEITYQVPATNEPRNPEPNDRVDLTAVMMLLLDQ